MVGIKRIFDIEHIFGIKKVEAGRYIIQCCFDFVLFSVSVEHSSKKKKFSLIRDSKIYSITTFNQ